MGFGIRTGIGIGFGIRFGIVFAIGIVFGIVFGWGTAAKAQGPEVLERPREAVLRAQSLWYPLAVHAAVDVSDEQVEHALRALEVAHQALKQEGWVAPPFDGGAGHSDGFDLYLVPTSTLVGAGRAGRAWGFAYPALESFGVVDPAMLREQAEACVATAYAEAALLGHYPHVEQSWRRATATWLAGRMTGGAACGRPRAEQREQPWRSFMTGGVDGGAGGALLLDLLDARHASGPGSFARYLWGSAQTIEIEQEGESVDMWAVLAQAERLEGSSFEELFQDLSVERYGAHLRTQVGARWWRSGELGAASNPHAPRLVHALNWRDLPARTPPSQPAVEPYGSAYIEVDVADAPAGSVLKVWLRGERGTRWSLVAARITDHAREDGARVVAPARAEPKSFVRVELSPRTKRVLLATTNLGDARTVGDEDRRIHAYHLIVNIDSPAQAP